MIDVFDDQLELQIVQNENGTPKIFLNQNYSSCMSKFFLLVIIVKLMLMIYNEGCCHYLSHPLSGIKNKAYVFLL